MMMMMAMMAVMMTRVMLKTMDDSDDHELLSVSDGYEVMIGDSRDDHEFASWLAALPDCEDH